MGGNTFIERALDDAQLLNLFRCRLDDLFALFLIDTEGRDEHEREKIIQATGKKIEQLCIVKRSLNKGISTHTDISAK